MANLIQIKRSAGTATPTSLANGELAFSSVSDALFIGSPNGSVVAIGGARFPGTLTANQALVANATGYIDTIKTANLVVTSITANGSQGSAGEILFSNGSTVYWASPATGSVSQVNTGVGLTGGPITATGTISINANDGIIANSTGLFVNQGTGLVVNATGVHVNTTYIGTLTSNNALYANSSNFANSASYLNGNTASDLQTYANDKAANAYSNAISYADTKAGTAYSNAVSYANTIAGTAYSNAVSYANTIAGTAYSNAVSYADAKAGNAYSNAISYADTKAATAYSNATTFSSTAAATAYSNATSYADTKAGTAYSNAMADTLTRNGTYTGNNTFNGATTTIANNVVLGSNSSHVVSINGVVNTALIPAANTTYDLGSSDKRWKDLYLSGTTLYLGTLSVSDASGALSTGNIVATTSLKTQDLLVEGNTTLGNNVSDVVSYVARVNTAINPAANITYDLGTNSLRWNDVHAQNVHSTVGYFDGSVYVGGDIHVTGNLITTNVSSVIISDPLIYLAGNNYASDIVDIGFVGNYNNGSANVHTGIFRHASTDQYYVFKGLTQELDGVNVVNIADPSFVLADINAYLLSGGLVSNSSTVAITANSTVNVAIVANSLSLSSALPVSSGGTGYKTYSTGDILVANSSSLTKLSIGTAGYVLQSNGTTLVYSTLDGGTF